jgi:hypothetical protein
MTVADDEDSLDDDSSLRELDETFTSLRELEEFEAIHDELNELLLDPSLELRMTVCNELLDGSPPRCSEDDKIVGRVEDDDKATVADDGSSLDDTFTSLREFEELEAIHEELIKFSDSTLKILSEFSSEQATKSSEQIGKILYKFITTPIKEYTGEPV